MTKKYFHLSMRFLALSITIILTLTSFVSCKISLPFGKTETEEQTQDSADENQPEQNGNITVEHCIFQGHPAVVLRNQSNQRLEERGYHQKWIYEYDENSILKQIAVAYTSDPSDTLVWEVTEHNKNGLPSKATLKTVLPNANKPYGTHFDFFYDQEGNLIKRTFSNSVSGNLMYSWSYDENDILISSSDTRTTYDFSYIGGRVSEITREREGKKEVATIEYDNDGNWRLIEYFEETDNEKAKPTECQLITVGKDGARTYTAYVTNDTGDLEWSMEEKFDRDGLYIYSYLYSENTFSRKTFYYYAENGDITIERYTKNEYGDFYLSYRKIVDKNGTVIEEKNFLYTEQM